MAWRCAWRRESMGGEAAADPRDGIAVQSHFCGDFPIAQALGNEQERAAPSRHAMLQGGAPQ